MTLRNKNIKFYKRNNFGRMNLYHRDYELAEIISMIKQKPIDPDAIEWPIHPNQLEAFQKLGFTFTSILDPGRKV